MTRHLSCKDAAVLTGWTYAQPGVANPVFFPGPATQSWRDPMINIASHHQTDAKTILNGVVVPANQTAAQDLKTTLDTIFNHPNVGPFIARQLIQRLVTSNPSPGYVYRVASVVGPLGSDDPMRELTRSAAFAPLRDGRPTLVLGSNRITAPAALDWWLILDASMPLSGAGSLFQTASPVPALGRPWRRDRWPGAGACTMYAGLPLGAPAHEVLARDTYGEQVARLLARHPIDAIVVVFAEGPGVSPGLTSKFVIDTLRELGFVPTEGSHVATGEALAFRRVRP